MNSLNFDATSNIQHMNPYSSAISSQYVVPPDDMPMNERISFNNANYLANYSQSTTPYTNAHIHNSASHVTPNSSRINKTLARYLSANTHDSASRVTSNHSQINENSAPYAKINAHNLASYFAHDHSRISKILARHSSAKTRDSALYIDLKSSRIEKDLAHTRNPYSPLNRRCPLIIDHIHYAMIT
jgi:hypothetical protein